MALLFDGYGDYIRITKEDIDAMMYSEVRWRDYATNGLLGEPTFKGVIDKDKWTKINERSRTYHFANGVTTSVDCPAWLWVSSTGTHYICEATGTIHIIAKGWFRITIKE